MPYYEYACQECGHRLEVRQKMSDPLLSDCPACSKPALKKLVSAGSFSVKGGGGSACAAADGAAPSCGAGGCCPSLG
ncbi:hypothetical protein BOW53_09935 [Solemya pervernicosa gill symbiont]|uniref:Zinc ribbon domain-containing protein n=2 Tax=Gammaproteobacteria incertae sedis TaxID=118884 RepID=A0A6N0I125_9GAMM|nr:hypothetical protein BOW53_09935 [Solemya pervernicosa gill symbiont]QKQ28305.1 zinc ribbon domain-containing protein [Candidatus Reidiella endopervernicosa]